MRKLFVGLFLLIPVAAQSAVEQEVLRSIQKMMAESGGQVTFSSLINEPSFTLEQKDFLKRLYEIFFEIPVALKSQYQSGGEVPTRQQLADSLGLSRPSIDLLLAVMRADSRVPKMFELDSASGEIKSIDVRTIDGFLQARGGNKRLSLKGEKLPPFSLRTLDGGRISSDDLEGQNVLVYFWFTGCPPCGKISPHLTELDRKYRDKGFKIIGVNADQVLQLTTTDKQRAQYLKRKEIRFVNAHLNDDTRAAFGGVNIFPMLFFADTTGTIVAHLINYHDMETLEGVVLEMLEE